MVVRMECASAASPHCAPGRDARTHTVGRIHNRPSTWTCAASCIHRRRVSCDLHRPPPLPDNPAAGRARAPPPLRRAPAPRHPHPCSSEQERLTAQRMDSAGTVARAASGRNRGGMQTASLAAPSAAACSTSNSVWMTGAQLIRGRSPARAAGSSSLAHAAAAAGVELACGSGDEVELPRTRTRTRGGPPPRATPPRCRCRPSSPVRSARGRSEGACDAGVLCGCRLGAARAAAVAVRAGRDGEEPRGKKETICGTHVFLRFTDYNADAHNTHAHSPYEYTYANLTL
jgi:hypothetical protein